MTRQLEDEEALLEEANKILFQQVDLEFETKARRQYCLIKLSCSCPNKSGASTRHWYLLKRLCELTSQPKMHAGPASYQPLSGCQILNTDRHHLPSHSLCQSSEAHHPAGHGQDAAADTQPTV